MGASSGAGRKGSSHGGIQRLEGASTRGPLIGSYKDMPIHDTLTIGGKVVRLDRVAIERRRDVMDLQQLRSGEVMVVPGLIYKTI